MALLRDTRWDHGAGRVGAAAAVEVGPGRREQARRKRDVEITWAYKGDGPATGRCSRRWSNLDFLPESWMNSVWQGPSTRCPLFMVLPGVVQGGILGFVCDLDHHTPLEAFPHKICTYLHRILQSSGQVSGGKKISEQEKSSCS